MNKWVYFKQPNLETCTRPDMLSALSFMHQPLGIIFFLIKGAVGACNGLSGFPCCNSRPEVVCVCGGVGGVRGGGGGGCGGAMHASFAVSLRCTSAEARTFVSRLMKDVWLFGVWNPAPRLEALNSECCIALRGRSARSQKKSNIFSRPGLSVIFTSLTNKYKSVAFFLHNALFISQC